MGSNKQYQDERDQVQAGNVTFRSPNLNVGILVGTCISLFTELEKYQCRRVKYIKHKEKRVMKDSTQQSDSTVTDK